jgi:hypothetical protein
LPFTDIILDHAAGHEIYTFLDGMSGYYQIYIREEDQVYTLSLLTGELLLLEECHLDSAMHQELFRGL